MKNVKIKSNKWFVVFGLSIAIVIGLTFVVSSQAAAGSSGCSCPYTKTTQYGGSGGNAFSDDLTMSVKITKISIRHGTYVDAIQTTWQRTSGEEYTGTRHGGGGGTETIINLKSDEYINRIEGRSGRYIDQLTFYTNKGNKFGPYGGSGGSEFSMTDLCVGGFFGSSGTYLDAIGVFTSFK